MQMPIEMPVKKVNSNVVAQRLALEKADFKYHSEMS